MQFVGVGKIRLAGIRIKLFWLDYKLILSIGF